jgi:hypothetical protein
MQSQEATNMLTSNSNPQPSTGKVTRSRSSNVTRIAREIVDLVEKINGPVPLNRIDEHVSGFRAPHGPSWSYFMRHSAGEAVLWDGMTEAGYKALRHVLNERDRVRQSCPEWPGTSGRAFVIAISCYE